MCPKLIVNIKTDLITNFMKKEGINQVEFCNLCNLSTSTFNNVLENNTSDVLPKEIIKIAEILKIELFELLI